MTETEQVPPLVRINQTVLFMTILREHKRGIHPKTGKKCNIWAFSTALTFTELDGEKYFYYGYTYKTALAHYKKEVIGRYFPMAEHLAR